MKDVFDELYEYGLIPVIKITDPDKAVPLAKALEAGGLGAAEVTFRTPCAADAIKRITDACPDLFVGAGTVLTPEQADKAWAAGAKFIVSPGLNPDVVRHCQKMGYPVLPGCATPSEIEQALAFGLKVVKFFPAEAAGGLSMIKAMSAPYGDLRFMPTGGINENNLGAYLAFPKIIACGGSFMVKEDLIAEGNFDEITRLTRAAVAKMLDLKLSHVGINCENRDEAIRAAKMFSALFLCDVKIGNASTFAGTAVELMHEPFYGKNGHIGISTPHPARAAAYFRRMGFAFREESAKYDEKGNLKVLYFADEICGFAVHIVKA